MLLHGILLRDSIIDELLEVVFSWRDRPNWVVLNSLASSAHRLAGRVLLLRAISYYVDVGNIGRPAVARSSPEELSSLRLGEIEIVCDGIERLGGLRSAAGGVRGWRR